LRVVALAAGAGGGDAGQGGAVGRGLALRVATAQFRPATRGAALAVAVVDAAFRHGGVTEQGAVEQRVVAAEVGPGEVGIKKARPTPGAATEFGAAKARPLQTRVGEDRAVIVGQGEIGSPPVDAAKRGAIEVLSHEGAAGEVAARARAARLRVGARLGPAAVRRRRLGLAAIRTFAPLLLRFALAMLAAALGL
jgi:hypothetical protein